MGRFNVGSSIHGCLVGTIVGDAIGLPYEALSRRRGIKLLGPPTRHRFVLGCGMMSDDGEHACMVAQSLCESRGDVERFRRALARRLRWWLLGIPAGIGGATLRAILKLWIGIQPDRSGVFSAGNGPAMRAALLGVAIQECEPLRAFVAASTTITHTDPKAFHGAMAVAIAARCASDNTSLDEYVHRLEAILANDNAGEMIDLVRRAVASSARGEATTTFADSIGCERGVSGYVYHTVPVAIHAWLRHRTSYADAVAATIECGGDTDTTAAIAGGIIGAAVGVDGIPPQWRDRMLEWPRTKEWIDDLARAVADDRPSAPRVNPLVIVRNLLFACIVFAHIARRALPPY